MSHYEEMEKILKALASRHRLRILDHISRGISDPNQIAQVLKRSRTTTEQHLKLLLAEKIIQKDKSTSADGRMVILYKIPDNSDKFLNAIRDLCRNFIHTRP